MGRMMTIGELIDSLRNCRNDAVVYFGFPGFMGPTKLASYRGFYNCPALGYQPQHVDENDKKAHTLAREIEDALGKTHEGWKGGSYRYSRNDELYVANPGNTSDVLVSGLLDEGWQAVILTEYRPS